MTVYQYTLEPKNTGEFVVVREGRGNDYREELLEFAVDGEGTVQFVVYLNNDYDVRHTGTDVIEDEHLATYELLRGGKPVATFTLHWSEAQ